MIRGSDGSRIPIHGAVVHVQGGQQTQSGDFVSTLQEQDVTSSGATLRGELLDLGGQSSVDVWFGYRLAGDEPSRETTKQSLSSAGEFSADVTGLLSDSIYDYWALVDVGTVYSGDVETFTTSA